MPADARIREAIERNVKVLSHSPRVGQGTATTKAVLHPRLDCTVTEGPYTLQVAMTAKYGGTGMAPTPGVLGRGALASCLAVGYGMWAARLGVPFDRLEVDVEADYDVRGELAVSDGVRPGYSQVRSVVTVESSAPERDVLRVLDMADRYSAYRDVFTNGVPLTREVRVGVTEG